MINRRHILIGAASGLTAAASGAFVLVNGFSPPAVESKPPERLLPEGGDPAKDAWTYHSLDLDATGALAHGLYPEGSCMYGVFGSVIVQLAERFGEPYASFPRAMMKYGASGIGDFGSVCGALNGAGALFGLFVQNKAHRNAMIEDLFAWYENAVLPIFEPVNSAISITTSVSNSVLCHASTANWVKASGHPIDGKDRSERCARLTADVAQRTAHTLNHYFEGCYEAASPAMDMESASCVQCHGNEGKLANIKGKMRCGTCHEKTLAHTLFANAHYHLMD